MSEESVTALVVGVADLHVNSRFGLCVPQLELDNGGYYIASKAQRELLRAWKEFWEIVADKKEELDAECYVFVDGDATDLNTHDDLDPISHNRSTIIEHACSLLWPARQVADFLFIVRGTEAHIGGHGELEEIVAKELGAQRDTKTGTRSWWWLPLEAAGVRFDIAHHPDTFSRRPWTLHAAANRQAEILHSKYTHRHKWPPDVAVRAHRHIFTLSNGETKPWTFHLPSWQLTNAFGHRLGAGGQIQAVGGVWWVCYKGEIENWDKELWRPQTTPVWRRHERA